MNIPSVHPLHVFKHCPRCGSADFRDSGPRSRKCASCGFTFYLNASAATAAVILNDKGQMLVSRRAFSPAQGTLDLPGGFVDPGETIEQGMAREIKEETGCDVASMEYLFSLPNKYIFSGFEVPTADCFFLCRLAAGAVPTASDDAAALKWVNISDLKPADFGLASIRKAVERLLDSPLLDSKGHRAPQQSRKQEP